jgi:hypothetical protein
MPVLLSADDEALIGAAELLDLDDADPAARFGLCVEQRYRLAATGSLDRVRGDTIRFRDHPGRGGMVPPFLGVCAVMVLAASRMTAADGMSAGNYYERLWDALGRRPGARPEFDYAPWLFRYLSTWLTEDLGGRRGQLLLAEGGPPHVGFAINQCVFRERDKEDLAEFFADRVGRRTNGVDLLRLLQVSAHRHGLTRRAQDAIADPKLQQIVRAALTHAFEHWDGTRPDVRGGRSWSGVLHLSINRGLRLSISAPDAPLGLDLGEGQTLEDRMAFGFDTLPVLAEHGLRYGQPGLPGVFLPTAGDTLIFEVREDSGLIWVRAASRPFVHVLSRDRTLQRSLVDFASQARGVGQLPARWRLYENVPAQMLPAELGTSTPAGVRPPVALAGGLHIDRRAWLVGYAPRIEIGDVEEPLLVSVNGGAPVQVDTGNDLPLDLPEGDHHIDVGGGLVAFTVHMLAGNPARPPYGTLRCALDARGTRTGASSHVGDPNVCGATLSTPYYGPLPLMLRGRSVLLITESGVGLIQQAPPPPGWLAAVGLDPNSARWEVALEADILWALTSAVAVAVRPVGPDRLDDAATQAIAALGSHARVRSLNRADRDDARASFAALVARATTEQAISA